MFFRRRWVLAGVIAMLVSAGPQLLAQSKPVSTLDRYRIGHSAHGKAFDEGPREKPVRMDGIGRAHFPITTSNPEVQAWFDQGHTLLLSFWFYEAERAFRWCLKLEPGNAMAYWGLVRASTDDERRAQFMKAAVERRERLSPRERAYIDAWAIRFDRSRGDEGERAYEEALERIVLAYPDDLEAKVLLAEHSMGRNRIGTELLLRQVLAAAPDHPAAHHYRIHNWDGRDGAQALDSCRKYGEIAPRIGHALHMPGHIYAGIGMYHEAAISLDSATRAEIRYMSERMVFPYNTWNYAHNRNYLSYVQEQLGLVSDAIRGARELLAVPLDPQLNDRERYSPHWQGIEALTRALVKYERWDDILAEDGIPWGDSLRDRARRAFVEARAHLGKGDRDAAARRTDAHAALKPEFDKPDHGWMKPEYETQAAELAGHLAVARGDLFTGLARLADAARGELTLRADYDDPPGYPGIGYVELGRAYLAARSPALARAAFDRALEGVPNDPFALAGLVKAHVALDDRPQAIAAYGRLLTVWADADAGLAPVEEVRALGLVTTPQPAGPAPERRYREQTLDRFGPAIWSANAAPAFSARDASGRAVSLADYRGRNVLLVFYLGGTCVHCMKQLKDIAARKDALDRLDTALVAVSSDAVAVNKAAQPGFAFTLLSDEKLEMARRFKSYDDFEDLALHSTILIDREGRIHWARHGGEPFEDVEFLLSQLRRMNEAAVKVAPASAAR